MAVIPLTVVSGLCLVFTFIVFFLRQHMRGRMSSLERDSLLPFADETQPAPVPVVRRESTATPSRE